MTTPPALLLVGDGTRDADGAEAFRSFVRELAEQNPELPVAGGFLGPARPSLTDAVAELVADGATQIAAVPVTLVPPAHANAPGSGMAELLAEAEKRHPGTSCTSGAALGAHPTTLSVLERRVEEAMSDKDLDSDDGGADDGSADGETESQTPSVPGQRPPRTPDDRARTTVLLVGGGSTDPYANAEVHRAARLLWEGRGYAGVEAAFVSFAGPDVASGLDRCRKLGATKIVVLPYLLFAGSLCERVRQQSAGWAAANPGVEVRSAEAVDGAVELTGLVMERYRETAGSGSEPAEQPEVRPDDVAHAGTR